MKRLGLLILVLLIIPQAGMAQRNTAREFLRTQGQGDSFPAARIIFHQTAEGQLCATLGITRGPHAIPKNSFTFERVTSRDGELESAKLRFKFPKKPTEKEESFTVWDSCVPSEPRQGEEGNERIEVVVRRPRMPPVELSIFYPPVDVAFAMNITVASDGGLMWENSVVDEDDAQSAGSE